MVLLKSCRTTWEASDAVPSESSGIRKLGVGGKHGAGLSSGKIGRQFCLADNGTDRRAVGIPAKLNTDSERKSNGVPG